MAVRTRYPLAATLPAEVLERPTVARIGFPFRLLLILGILPLLLSVSVLAMYRHQQRDRVYSGVRVYGLDLSRMTREEAAGALKRHLAESSRRKIALRFDEDALQVSLGALGLVVDDSEIGTLVEKAWSVGRNEDLRGWLTDQLVLLRHGFDVPATARFDPNRAVGALNDIKPDVERVTLNADLTVQRAGDGFEVHTAPAQTGRRLNVQATIERLQASAAGTLPEGVDLALEEAPPVIGDADLVQARETILVLLGPGLELRDGARTWRLDPPAAFDMLEVSGLKERALPVTAKLNDEKLAQFVERTARAADQPAVNPIFAIENDEVVVKPGRPGKLADAAKTLELTKERLLAQGTRAVEISFKEDLPWLSERDLEPWRAQANALLDLPITIQTPAVAGIPERTWTLGRRELAQMAVVPATQSAPREYATMPAAQRPRFEITLDSARVGAYISREIAPWVSEDPVDAALEMTVTRVEVPNPAYAAAVAAEQRRVQAEESEGRSVTPARISISPTIQENRYTVGLRNARDGRGPDVDATFRDVMAVFRAGLAALPPVGQLQTLPVFAPDAPERRVTVRLAPRRPRVADIDLAAARDLANVLIGEPVQLRWGETTWTVTRDELASMLRYQPGRDGRQTAYLTRDGLLAKAGAIAREAERLPSAPKGSDGKTLPLDVAATASAIWQAASTGTTPGGRVAEVVWGEDESLYVITTDEAQRELAASPSAPPAAGR